MDHDIDLLALLDDGSVGFEVAVQGGCSGELCEQPPSVAPSESSSSTDRECSGSGQGIPKVKLPSVAGKIGSGRHGDQREKELLGMHMRHCKVLHREANFRQGIADILTDSTFKKDGKLVAVRADAKCSGVIIRLAEQNQKGNRFRRSIPWCDFLAAAFGRLKRDSHIALAMDISRQTSNFMTTMVGSVYLGQQAALVGAFIALTKSKTPTFCIRHVKWDETTLWTAVDLDRNQTCVASAWQVMVQRQRVIIGWEDGSCSVIRLVMAPVTLLATGAHHMYYALKNHPLWRSLQGLVSVLSDQCFHRVEVYESDGAKANERLIAHLIQVNKKANRPVHLIHCKCMNHQVQLVNVALIAHVGCNVLNRMYGFAVFIRQLGNWLRLKQALFAWVDRELVFTQDVVDVDCPKSVHPGTLELIDFLRSNRRVESENSDTSPAFERAVEEFLQMWNGCTDLDRPCHRCTHQCFPLHQRHCQSRAAAVRRCVDSLVDLLMSSMPSVPAPNKWTTLYPCLVALFKLLFRATVFFLFLDFLFHFGARIKTSETIWNDWE